MVIEPTAGRRAESFTLNIIMTSLRFPPGTPEITWRFEQAWDSFKTLLVSVQRQNISGIEKGAV